MILVTHNAQIGFTFQANFVCPGTEPGLHLLRMVIGDEHRHRHNGREGVELELAHQPHAFRRGAVPVDEQQAGVPAQHDRLDLFRLAEHQ